MKGVPITGLLIAIGDEGRDTEQLEAARDLSIDEARLHGERSMGETPGVNVGLKLNEGVARKSGVAAHGE